VVSVRKVKSRHVHAFVDHLDEVFDFPAGGPERAHNLDLARVGVDLLENVIKLDVLRVG